MKRREFVTLIGGTALTWPLAARAQQAEQMRRVGVLMGYSENDPEGRARVAAFREGLQAHRVEVAALATRFRLPAVYAFRYFADVGGLMSYGSDQIDDYRRAATYGELPVQTPVKFELVVNLKTAKALDLVIPQAVLSRADEVIE